MQTIRGEDYLARYDANNQILYGVFSVTATPQSTADLYDAIMELMASIDVKSLHGLVMDFRRVERFDKGNMNAVKAASHELDRRYDVKHLPVALVVETHLQEQIVDLTTRVTPAPERKQIVYTIAEAHRYFAEWQSHHNVTA